MSPAGRERDAYLPTALALSHATCITPSHCFWDRWVEEENPIPNMSANGTIHPSCTIDEGMISTARRKRQAPRFRSQKLLRAFVALWRALSISVPPPHRIRNRHKHLMKVARSYMVAHAEGAQREGVLEP